MNAEERNDPRFIVFLKDLIKAQNKYVAKEQHMRSMNIPHASFYISIEGAVTFYARKKSILAKISPLDYYSKD